MRYLSSYYNAGLDETRIFIGQDDLGFNYQAKVTGDKTGLAQDAQLELALDDCFTRIFASRATKELSAKVVEGIDKIDEALAKVAEAQSKVEAFEATVQGVEGRVSSILMTVGKVVIASNLPEDAMADIVAAYPTVQVGDTVEAGKIYQVGGKLVQAIQSVRIDAEGWLTDPSIFKGAGTIVAGDTEVVADFVQPTGGHDAYAKGAKVVFEGKIYESLMDANSFSPTAYPQGWKVVE